LACQHVKVEDLNGEVHPVTHYGVQAPLRHFVATSSCGAKTKKPKVKNNPAPAMDIGPFSAMLKGQ